MRGLLLHIQVSRTAILFFLIFLAFIWHRGASQRQCWSIPDPWGLFSAFKPPYAQAAWSFLDLIQDFSDFLSLYFSLFTEGCSEFAFTVRRGIEALWGDFTCWLGRKGIL